MQSCVIKESRIACYLFSNPKISWFWFIVRIYVGWQWLEAGWGKLGVSVWTGDQAGSALTGFLQGAFQKTVGAHPDVQSWYAVFLENIILPNASFWSYLITYGEIIVGIALILGIFTGLAAFLGIFMNFNFLLAGTVSINPILFVLGFLLVMAWRVAGYIGLDYYILPWISNFSFKRKII